MTLDEKLQNLPVQPGVYIHKNAKGTIIYIGKAKSLRNRVRQYFQSSRGMDAKTQEMVARIADFEFIITDTEVEALVLESNMIKQHKPRYNVMLKDDKSYPHLKVTINEDLPRIFKTRHVEKDGGAYRHMEDIALSRDIPGAVRWFVDPIVRRISRSSLVTSLKQTKEAVGQPENNTLKRPEHSNLLR